MEKSLVNDRSSYLYTLGKRWMWPGKCKFVVRLQREKEGKWQLKKSSYEENLLKKDSLGPWREGIKKEAHVLIQPLTKT
jgi:hypothetical protein